MIEDFALPPRPKQAILLVSWYGTVHLARELLETLKDYRKVQIVVAITECEKLPDASFTHWVEENGWEYLPIQGNRWECGGLTAMMGFTDYEEFVLIQDTLEVKDTRIFDILFAPERDGKSVAFGKDWLCYLGKYRRAVLDQMPIPICLTKMDAYYNEHMVANIYMYIAERMEGKPVEVLFPEWTNQNPKNWTDVKWGRENLVLYNHYLIKRKSLLWDLPPYFKVKIYHIGD